MKNSKIKKLLKDDRVELIPITDEDYYGIERVIGVSIYEDNEDFLIDISLKHEQLEVIIWLNEEQKNISEKNYNFISNYVRKSLEELS